MRNHLRITLAVLLALTGLFTSNHNAGAAETMRTSEQNIAAMPYLSGDAQKLMVRFSIPCPSMEPPSQWRFTPPVNIRWQYDRRNGGQEYHVTGEFKPGVTYRLYFRNSTLCDSNYRTPSGARVLLMAENESRQTWSAEFTVPDLPPSASFIESGSVIERESRQMLHVSVTNVEALAVELTEVPPIAAPLADASIRSMTPEALAGAIESLMAGFRLSMASDPALFKRFTGAVARERKVFFPGLGRNEQGKLSLPLSFRSDREHGGVRLVSVGPDAPAGSVRQATRLIRLTDLSLSYKLSRTEMLVWATSLHAGKAARGVDVIARMDDGAFVHLGRTEASGTLRLEAGASMPYYFSNGMRAAAGRPFEPTRVEYLVAATDTDATYVRLKKGGNLRPEWITQNSDPTKEASLVRSTVFTERGIYRPGETVYFKGVARQLMGEQVIPPVTGPEATVVVTDARDTEVYRASIPFTLFGSVSGSLPIKPHYTLGTYTVTMTHGRGESASRTFEVQEFRPPRHFARVAFAHVTRPDTRYVGVEREMHLVEAEITGQYYAGGPVKGGKVRWKIYKAGTSYAPPGLGEYEFGSYVAPHTELLESGESLLDDQGRLTVSVPVGMDVVAGQRGIEVIATVLDFDGRAASESAVFQERPAYSVGISKHAGQIDAGAGQLLTFAVLDDAGARVREGDVSVEVLRATGVYVRKRRDDGTVYWSYEDVLQKQYEARVPIEDGTGVFEFDLLYGGDYVLRAMYRAPDGTEHVSSTHYEVEGYFYGYEYDGSRRNFERLVMVPDKGAYRPGETARIYLKPHRGLASVLVSVEREGIVEYRVLPYDPEHNYVEVPLTAASVPNVYVTVLGTVPRGEYPVYREAFDTESPGFLYGAVSLEVRQEAALLDVRINEGERLMKAGPGDEVTLVIEVADSAGAGVLAEMAVGVVDESVLAMTGYATPKLDGLLRFTVPLAVATGESRVDLMSQTPFGEAALDPLTGGGGLEGRPEAVSSKVRKDFNPVAFFAPNVLTDADGRARVTFRVPDTMTTYRVYVVAADMGSRVASVQRDLLVVKDFYIEPGMPRFFTRGDTFRFNVSAFNKTDAGGTVSLGVEHDEHLALTAPGGQSPVGAMDSQAMSVSGEALRAGRARMTFRAALSGAAELEDVVELTVPVNSGLILKDDTVLAAVSGTAIMTYAFPPGLLGLGDGFLGERDLAVTLHVSGSPFLRMGKGLRYLLDYPYGCVEQTSSRVLPLAALRMLIRDRLVPDVSLAETDKFLASGVSRLLGMQTASGGFGYWPGNIRPSEWGTLYAMSALSVARAAGIEVPEENMQLAYAYIKSIMVSQVAPDTTFRGFGLYVLAMNSALDEQLYRSMTMNQTAYTREGMLLALMAGRLAGYEAGPASASTARSVLDRSMELDRSDYFYARYREPAIALLVADAYGLADAAGQSATGLIGGMDKSGIWTSTSDTGWALYALGTHFKGMGITNSPVTLEYSQAGWPATSVSIDPAKTTTIALEPGSFIRDPRVMLRTPEGASLVTRLDVRYPRLDYSRTGYSSGGFRLSKKIENVDGSGVIRVGDVVRVTLYIDFDHYDYRFIVVDDPLPAGLVAINTAIKTEEFVDNARERSSDDEDWYWSEWDSATGSYRFVPNHFEMRDDRVLAFKDRAWGNRYFYTYYARAVCEGRFRVPPATAQLMYSPSEVSYTPETVLTVEGN